MQLRLGHELGKLIHLAALLVQHGEAIEADLAGIGVDLLDFYRPNTTLTVRKLWVIVSGLLMRRGTALTVDIIGARGSWTLLEEMAGKYLGHPIPEDKEVTNFKASNQARIKKLRADRQAERERQAQLNSG